MNQQDSIVLIAGDDELARKERARALIDRIVPAVDQAFGVEIVEGQVESATGAETALKRSLEALQTVGFLGLHKVVWLRDAAFLGDLGVLKAGAVKSQMEALIGLLGSGSGGGNVLLITTPKVDKRSAFFRVCQERGDVQECWLPEKAYQAKDAVRLRVREELAQRGLTAADELVQGLVHRVGEDPRQIVTEVEKIALYLGDRKEVRPQDLAAIVSASREAMTWDLADAVGHRNLPAALGLLRQLLFQRESPVRLIAAVGDRMRDLTFYRTAVDLGWVKVGHGYRREAVEWGPLPPEVDQALSQGPAKDPRAVHPYRMKQLVLQALNFTAVELRRGQELVLSAHERLVSSSVAPAVTLELLLVRLLPRTVKTNG